MKLSKNEEKEIGQKIRDKFLEHVEKRPVAWKRKVARFEKKLEYERDQERKFPDSHSFSFDDPVEYYVRRMTRQMIRDINNCMYHYNDVYIISGNEYSIFEMEMMMAFRDGHEPGDDGCKKDHQCLGCGDPICLDCCHWSPLLYTHPENVYCPKCCPSCHHAKKISKMKIPREVKEILEID